MKRDDKQFPRCHWSFGTDNQVKTGVEKLIFSQTVDSYEEGNKAHLTLWQMFK